MDDLGEVILSIICCVMLVFAGFALYMVLDNMPEQNDIDTNIVDNTIYTVTYKDNGDIETIVGTIEETNDFTAITNVYGKTTKINNAFIISIVER